MVYELRNIGKVNGAFTAATGTIPMGNAKAAIMTVSLDANAANEIAVLPTKSAAGTASKSNCAGIVTDLDPERFVRPSCGSSNWYLAYKKYSGTASGGTSVYDYYVVEKLG